MRIVKRIEIVEIYIEGFKKLLENAKNDDEIDVDYCKECLRRLNKRKKELEAYL